MADTGMVGKTDIRSAMVNPGGWKSLLTFFILTLAWLAGFSSRLFAVIRFESIIHEFDPWFNYRATHHMVTHGFYNFLNWFDDRAWYPLGRIVGGTVYPGLMVTSGSIHAILNVLNIPVHIRDICVFLAPVFSGLTSLAVYFFTKEVWSAGAGLFAACFIAIVAAVINQIKNLRTQFTRLIKCPASGSERKWRTVRQQWIVKQLEFLHPYIRSRETTSSAIFENNKRKRDDDIAVNESDTPSSTSNHEDDSSAPKNKVSRKFSTKWLQIFPWLRYDIPTQKYVFPVPGYISRSVAGSYDNEGIAIFALMFTYYLWYFANVEDEDHPALLNILSMDGTFTNFEISKEDTEVSLYESLQLGYFVACIYDDDWFIGSIVEKSEENVRIKAVKSGQIFWGICTALSYFYMVSAWGGYVFIINLIPLHVFTLLLMGRYSKRIFTAYTSFFIVGLILSMQIPFVGFQPIRTSEHMAAAGVFALLNAYAALKFVQSFVTKAEFRYIFIMAVSVAASLVFLMVVCLTWAGYIAPWSGRFYSLWDTGYAKIHIPIIASVSEHQPTTWVSFFFDLHILICAFPAGVWYCVKHVNDERVFVVLYAIFASYFAGVMVRLMLTLTPIVCVLAAIAFSKTMEIYLKDDTPKINHRSCEKDQENKNERLYDKVGKAKKISENKPKDDDTLGVNIKSVIVIAMLMMLMLFAVHCTWVTSSAYSSPSIVLASYGQGGSRTILDDFREAYFWLRHNTDDKARIMSWWDYGYQIAGMGNKTTLVDNNTWNNSHIALVGKAMSSNESAAYDIMRALDVDYVLVIFGGVIGYSGDDINKFLWMVRIAEGEHPKDIRESDYFTPQGEFRVDSAGSQTLLNCLMYKLSYYRFGQLQLDVRTPTGFDRTRGVEIGNKNFELTHMEEAYTTEHWLVRIFKVKDLSNRLGITSPNKPVKKSYKKKSKKSGKKKAGSIKDKPKIIKGVRPSKK